MIKNLLLLTAFLSVTTEGHDAISCFRESAFYGGMTVDQSQYTDLDLLLNLDLDHVLTSIKVCTDRAITFVKGIQASYGKFNGVGEIIEAVSLNPLGDVDHATSLCTIFYIPRDQYLASILIRYSDLGISQVWPTTNLGKSSSYGKEPSNLETETVLMKFALDDQMFFGFKGKQRQVINQELTSLGVVSYEASCVAKERLRQGNDFSWGSDAELALVINSGAIENAGGTQSQTTDGTDGSGQVTVNPDEKKDMPTSLKVAFLVSFIFNFLAIIIICLCCRYRKRGNNKQDFAMIDAQQAQRAGLRPNNIV